MDKTNKCLENSLLSESLAAELENTLDLDNKMSIDENQTTTSNPTRNAEFEAEPEPENEQEPVSEPETTNEEPFPSYLTVPPCFYKLPKFILDFPLPLLLSDVMQLEFEKPFQQYKICGHIFKTVLIFGRALPIKAGLLYRVDDGTGTIVVNCKKIDNQKYKNRNLLKTLRLKLVQARRFGIPELGDSGNPNSEEFKSHLYSLNVMYRVIKHRVGQSMKVDYKHGSKLAVVGAPYRVSRNCQIKLYAHHVAEFTGPNVDFELSFKQNLINIYRYNFINTVNV